MDSNGSERTGILTGYYEDKLPARLLSVSEVARFLGVHSSTVRRWEKKGLLKSYAIGLRNNLRFKQEDVLHFLDNCDEENEPMVSLDSVLDDTRVSINTNRGKVKCQN